MAKSNKSKSKGDVEERESLLSMGDDDGFGGVGVGGGGDAMPIPALRPYRDDPNAIEDAISSRASASATRSSDGGESSTMYRDDGEGTVEFKNLTRRTTLGGGSIFDWGESAGEIVTQISTDGNDSDDDEAAGETGDGIHAIDEFDTSGTGFSPVSLHDDDSVSEGTGDEEEGGGRSLGSDGRSGCGRGGGGGSGGSAELNREQVRIKASRLLSERDFEDFDDFEEDGPRKNSGGAWRVVCAMMAFAALVVGSGFFGYEAGLPVEDDVENAANGSHTTHPKGEEWIQWLEREKEEIHMPHWQWHKQAEDAKKASSASTFGFEPKTQAELLGLSEHVVQSCSERSLLTVPGRRACLSLCTGRFCCFEKDVEFGSCVAEDHSYCFAYAACENAIADFAKNGAVTAVEEKPAGQGHNLLNAMDVKFLEETCSEANIRRAEGMRDCNAFCKHQMCCFEGFEGEGCREDRQAQCEAYDACRILDEKIFTNNGKGNAQDISGPDAPGAAKTPQPRQQPQQQQLDSAALNKGAALLKYGGGTKRASDHQNARVEAAIAEKRAMQNQQAQQPPPSVRAPAEDYHAP